MLDELTNNAQNWVQKQTAALSQELEQHRQIIRAAQLAQATAPRQTQQLPKTPGKTNVSEEKISIDTQGPELIRVELKRDGFTCATYVSSASRRR